MPKKKKSIKVASVELTGFFPSEYKPVRDTDPAETILGMRGRMISGSKSGYHRAFPQQVPVFNANICTNKGKIWYGDIDLTLDEAKLQQLSRELRQNLYVLYEMDGRFENESVPQLDRAVFVVMGSESIVTERLSHYVQRCNRGKYKGKIVYKKEFRR